MIKSHFSWERVQMPLTNAANILTGTVICGLIMNLLKDKKKNPSSERVDQSSQL